MERIAVAARCLAGSAFQIQVTLVVHHGELGAEFGVDFLEQTPRFSAKIGVVDERFNRGALSRVAFVSWRRK